MFVEYIYGHIHLYVKVTLIKKLTIVTFTLFFIVRLCSEMLHMLAAYIKSSGFNLLPSYWGKEGGIQVSVKFQHRHLEVSFQCWSCGFQQQ